jgi:hypothetical protein
MGEVSRLDGAASPIRGPEPDCEAVHDIGWLLEKAEAAIIRHGAKVLLIDPWNQVGKARRETSSSRKSKFMERFPPNLCFAGYLWIYQRR